MIGKTPWQRALGPTWMLPVLLACQSPRHAPLWCRGKWVVGVGPLITSSREHRPPWGMRRVTLLSSLNKIFICYFFPPWLDNSIPSVGGEHAHQLSVAELTRICPPLQFRHETLYKQLITESIFHSASLDCTITWIKKQVRNLSFSWF